MPVEVVFLGTGTSSSVPHIDCITAHAIPGSSQRPPCRTCLSTIDGSIEGKKNIRRNTSIVVRLPGKAGSVTVLVDCGKNFQAAAVEWFPKYGLRRIDAVLITHAHADAVNGLDDLRAWTLGKRIQPHIDLYVSKATFQDIKRMFPYLVSREFATGGGDVCSAYNKYSRRSHQLQIPEFVWHVCIENALPFEIQDTSIMVTPFLVHHGRLFTTPTPLSAPPAPSSVEKAETHIALNDVTPGIDIGQDPKQEVIIQPYMCFAFRQVQSFSCSRIILIQTTFRIQEDIVYLSDCGAIPDEAWPALFPVSGRQLPVCILDCLNLRKPQHPSHFGLETAVAAARRIGAKRTYLLGFSHEVAHDEYVTIGEAIGGAAVAGRTNLTENEVKGLEQIGEGDPIWVRPAHDGLKIQISTAEEEREVTDETYS
ncbi:beta-lactamase-like protein [Mycena pura]|uniref:Beta-lactamase-like protein n=1 Tax=Mycena pura TaxID=153505 RepID=A0AAD6YQ72_9AGAR|nr:beta-lactamase-like protein [Mycena pura]